MREATVFAPQQGIWVQWFGHPLRYLATAEQTDSKYCLSIGAVEQGQGASPHSHGFDEGFYILEGTVEFTAGNQKVLLHQGDFINVKAGTVHYPRGASEKRSRMLVVAAPCGFDEFQIRVGGRIDSPHAKGAKSEDEMHRLVDQIASEYGIQMHPTADQLLADPKFHVTRSTEGKIFDVVGD